MSLHIESDLRLEFEGHELSLRDDGEDLVAEFSSLSAVRRLRRTLKVLPGPLPPVCRLPGLDEITARGSACREKDRAAGKCFGGVARIKRAVEEIREG